MAPNRRSRSGSSAWLRERKPMWISLTPETKPWAMREFCIEDVYGHVFRIGQSTLMT